MKQKAYQAAFPVAPVVVMAAFLTAVFFADANISFAGANQKDSSGYERISSVEYTEAQIKAVQDALMITEAQNESWNRLTQVMRENAKEMDALRKERADNDEDMNAVERTKFHRQIIEAHLDQLKKFLPVFETFYDSLTDEQKESTDSIFRRGK